jgi:hypothetical protein
MQGMIRYSRELILSTFISLSNRLRKRHEMPKIPDASSCLPWCSLQTVPNTYIVPERPVSNANSNAMSVLVRLLVNFMS